MRILATTSTYPLLQEFVDAYHPADTLLAVERATAGWETVYTQLLAGDVPFALTTCLPPDASLWAAPVGWDGVAVVVHVTNAVPSLDLEMLRLVFQGRSTSWADAGGDDVPITVVSREEGAASRQVFEALVMGQSRITAGARLALSSASVIDIVGSVPGAIGFVSMAYVDDRVRAVPLRVPDRETPVVPSPDAVSSGDYPLRSPILIVGLEAPPAGSVYWDWFAWMQSEPGQRVVGRRYGALSPEDALFDPAEDLLGQVPGGDASGAIK